MKQNHIRFTTFNASHALKRNSFQNHKYADQQSRHCAKGVSINAMSQNDPAVFTLNDVSQLIYFISYTAGCPRQTKHGHYFLPTIFRNI